MNKLPHFQSAQAQVNHDQAHHQTGKSHTTEDENHLRNYALYKKPGMKPLISTKISTNFRIGIRNFQLRKLSLGMLLIFLIGMQIFVNDMTLARADAPPGCIELVRNGSFESLTNDWVSNPNANPVPVYDSGFKLDGLQSLRLGVLSGGNPIGKSAVSQEISLPADAASILLSYRFYSTYNGIADGDIQYVDLMNVATTESLRLINEASASTQWRIDQRILTDRRGQTIRLTFGVDNNGGPGRAGMYIDGVSIISCTSIPPTNTFTPTSTSVIPTATVTPTPTNVTATPTTPPSTPLACGGQDLIQNGNFEVYDNYSSWKFGDDPIPGRYMTTDYNEGSRSVLLGNPRNSGWPDVKSYSSIRQFVTVPPDASAVQLSWHHLYKAEGTHDSHEVPCQQVILLAPNGEVIRILEHTHSNEDIWGMSIIDISEMRGKSFYVYFNALNDGDEQRTWMYIDDVSLRACFPAVNSASAPIVMDMGPTPTLIPLNQAPVSIQAAQAPILQSQAQIQIAAPSEVLVEVPTATLEPFSQAVVEPAANVQVAASAVLQGGSDVIPPENTPTPASPSLWERLFGAATSAPEPTTATPTSVGFDRLGTVAVLLGILVIIALLASAIVRMLRGR